MRNVFFTAASSVAMLAACPSLAAVVTVTSGGTAPSTLPIVLLPLGSGVYTGGSSDQFLGTPPTTLLPFTFAYTFALPTNGAGSFSFTTTSSATMDAVLQLTSVSLGSSPFSYNTTTDPSGAITYAGTGAYGGGTAGDILQLNFTGNVLRGGTLATSLSFNSNGGGTPPTDAAPEPVSWAMMLVGFGVIGATLRSRRRATVTFV